MKKLVIFLISVILSMNCVNLYAQTKMNPAKGKVMNFTNNIINEEEACSFRFLLESPPGFGWIPDVGIEITVDGVDYGFLNLPWGTSFAEETLLLPSGEILFFWIGGTFSPSLHYFEIYNSSDELIYTSPDDWFYGGLLFTYQNECPECIPLSYFEGEYNSETKLVSLSWTAPESADLTGFDIFRNGILHEHVAATTIFYTDNTADLEDGDYKYCVVPVYPFSCTFEEECFETYISNVGINNYSSAFRLYPNPARDELRVTSDKLQVTSVEIFDVFGRKQNAECRKQKAEGEVVLNISHLAAGVYFIKLTDGQNSHIQRFIKK
jgi:hypothetical protein